MRGFRICCFSSLLGGDRGGWVWLGGGFHYCTRSQVVSAHKAFLSSFFSSSEFGCIYIDVQGHSFIYTTFILSCPVFTRWNGFQNSDESAWRALCTYSTLHNEVNANSNLHRSAYFDGVLGWCFQICTLIRTLYRSIIPCILSTCHRLELLTLMTCTYFEVAARLLHT